MTDPPKYRCSIEQCDVHDRSTLVAYRAKRDEWLTLLEYEPQHSVFNQLSHLLWGDAAFHLFNEMKRLAPISPIASPLLAEALDNGYVSGAILGIGRLTDSQSRDPKKGVVSLRRVVEDIRASRQVITRETYICHDGLRYDPWSIPFLWDRDVLPGRVQWVEIGGPLDRDTPEFLHERFDKLSGVMPSQRRRSDTIAESTFDDIEALLSTPEIAKMRLLRNKFVAHAADTRSRSSALAGFDVSMAEVEGALRSLLRAHRKIGGDLLWSSAGSLMPIAQFDVLDGLVATLPQEQQEDLQRFWGELSEQRAHWHEDPANTP